MNDKKELTRGDEMSLAGAALRGAPWRTAVIGGGAVAGASLVMEWALPGPAEVTWSLCLGITLFTLIAAIGAISRPNVNDRVTRQARVWALRHPFKFALYPAAAAAILMYPVQLILDADGMFGAAWDALWGGALVYLISGVLAVALKGRAAQPR